MTVTARKLLAEFDALPPGDQHQVAAEILRRTAETGDLPDTALDELAAELFRTYDAEEAPVSSPDRGEVWLARACKSIRDQDRRSPLSVGQRSLAMRSVRTASGVDSSVQLHELC
jgi:hypothetical protein